MPEVSPGFPDTPASSGHEELPTQLPLWQTVIGEGADGPSRQMVQLTITGDRPVINYISHNAVGGTNATLAGWVMAGQAAVLSHGSTGGYQTTTEVNAGAISVESMQAGRDVAGTRQDVAVVDAGGQPVKESWWTRLRKRGAVVAVATIIGSIASLGGIAVAILIAAGWKP
jgi:hypothetical protein